MALLVLICVFRCIKGLECVILKGRNVCRKKKKSATSRRKRKRAEIEMEEIQDKAYLEMSELEESKFKNQKMMTNVL